MTTITATELARNTSDILDKIAGGGEVVMVERNRAVVARIGPPGRTMIAAEALAALQPVMTSEQAAAWLRDSRKTLDEAVLDPWA